MSNILPLSSVSIDSIEFMIYAFSAETYIYQTYHLHSSEFYRSDLDSLESRA